MDRVAQRAVTGGKSVPPGFPLARERRRRAGLSSAAVTPATNQRGPRAPAR